MELVTDTIYGPFGWESITYYRPLRNVKESAL
jgi:hypothetical protein